MHHQLTALQTLYPSLLSDQKYLQCLARGGNTSALTCRTNSHR
jgi:hypothetical protein